MTRKIITSADGKSFVYNFETADDKTVVKFDAVKDKVSAHSKSDSFGRKIFDEFQLGSGFISRQFSYHAGEETREHKKNEKLMSSPTTQLVSEILLSDGRTLSYEYDAEERITSVTESYKTADNKTITNITEYTYDALGQLLTETVNGSVVNSMKYDNYGNIVSKNGKEYLYDTTWRDLLKSYDGYDIEYDAQGNPTKYLGHTLTWEKGRQLRSFDNNTYTYNANGIRTSKTVNGVKHEYTLDGTKILRETWNGNTLVPIYDSEDSVCGIIYNGTPHYFLKNLQGDIIAIANAKGEVEARYTYDAWGAITNISGTDEGISIAVVNPFRYRGYYYDVELDLYYLGSRYYDPYVGRFISPDAVYYLGANGDLVGYNLYSYCSNNPVMYVDPSGHAILSVFVGLGVAALIGAGIGMASYAAGQVIDCSISGDFDWSWGEFLGSAVGGAVGGMVSYILPFAGVESAATIAFAGGAITTAGTMLGGNIIDDMGYSAADIVFNSAKGGIFSAISISTMSKIRISGLNAGRGNYYSISNQIYTKFRNQTIRRITIKTFGKMFVSEAYNSVLGVFGENMPNSFN